MIQYETKRLLLSTKNEFAFQEILQFYQENKAHLEPFEPTRSDAFYTPEYQLKTLSMETQLTKSHNYLRLWLSLKDDPNTIIGTICFSDIFRNRAYLAYKMDYRYTGNGYCYEACNKGLSIMKDSYDVDCVIASVLPDNTPSLQVLKRLDFLYKGIEKQAVSIQNQEYHLLRYQKSLR